MNLSYKSAIGTEVPQEPILRPLMFIVYMNGTCMCKCGKFFHFTLHADDLIIHSTLHLFVISEKKQWGINTESNIKSTKDLFDKLERSVGKSKFMVLEKDKWKSNHDHFISWSIANEFNMCQNSISLVSSWIKN